MNEIKQMVVTERHHRGRERVLKDNTVRVEDELMN